MNSQKNDLNLIALINNKNSRIDQILYMKDFSAEKIAGIAGEVELLLDGGRREAAIRHAMDAVIPLLSAPTDELRLELRRGIFDKFTSYEISYQHNDFESVDYEMFEVDPDLPLFRGPRLPRGALEAGEYFCVIGAAQTFGRLVRRPWPVLLGDQIGLPPLNLSRGGVGPDFFLHPKIIELARNARFVILQVMSGRSVGCDEFPGGRRLQVPGEKGFSRRLDVLREIWDDDRKVALRYVKKWNENYVSIYNELKVAIDKPTLLLWISGREPGGWRRKHLLKGFKTGSFPQLIGEKTYGALSEIFDDRYEAIIERTSEQPLNRLTGEPCPYFGDNGKNFHAEFNYYPSSKSNGCLAEALAPWAQARLEHQGKCR